MLEYPRLVYLDLQKTGTTSIVQLLRAISREDEVPTGGHSYPRSGHDTEKFHFISIRNPLSIYISLFAYGVSGRGGLYRGLHRRGVAEKLYIPSVEGFGSWLEFMLDPLNVDVLGIRFSKLKLQGACGPLTQRLLLLSMVDPFNTVTAAQPRTAQDILTLFHERRIYDEYVRTEHIVDDLFRLWTPITANLKVRRKYRDLQSAEELKAIMPRKNTGDKVEGVTADVVPQQIKDRVREQEALFYDAFGYADDPKGAEPPLRTTQAADDGIAKAVGSSAVASARADMVRS